MATASARSAVGRPGRAPRGFPNWDKEDAVWRNDDGDVAPSREEREKQKVARRAAKRQAQKLDRAKTVIEADPVGACTPFAPVPPHHTMLSSSGLL